jgi:hypothetical protein
VLRSAPRPGFEELRGWARLSLAAGLRERRLERSLVGTHRLARLLLTVRHFAADLVAVWLLQDANEAARLGGRQPPVDVQTLAALARHLPAVRGLITPLLDDGTLDRVLDLGAPGVCAALAAELPYLQTLRYALERRHPRFYQRLDALVAGDSCGATLALARRAWRPKGELALLERWGHADGGWDDRASMAVGWRVPELRENFGESCVLRTFEPFESRYLTP